MSNEKEIHTTIQVGWSEANQRIIANAPIETGSDRREGPGAHATHVSGSAEGPLPPAVSCVKLAGTPELSAGSAPVILLARIEPILC